MKRVKCKSGLMGWQAKLQNIYENFTEFKMFCEHYAIHKRLGFKNILSAWEHNPTIQGSVNPSDLRKI